MRESIQVEQIRCERCVTRLATELSPVSGVNEARVELGTSSIMIDYDDAQQPEIDAAIKRAGFTIVQRTPVS